MVLGFGFIRGVGFGGLGFRVHSSKPKVDL